MFLFKLNPVGFYLLLVQQVFYVYCQFICYCIIMLYGFSNYLILELIPIIFLRVLAEQVLLGEFCHGFKNFLVEMVGIPTILHFTCNPLSDVIMIGFSSLYFIATDRIMLSGDR
mgnify:CR=1 FL=1